MTIDQAISDLLSVSTDVRRVAVLDAQGAVLAAGPAPAGDDLSAGAGRLWQAAAARAGTQDDLQLEHVVVHDSAGAVAMLAAHGRRIVALTGRQPVVGLLIFDLRTCLSDALAMENEA